MAIQNRRGDYNDYKPSRMLSGELGVTLDNDPKAVDGKALHVAFAPGVDKTLMTFEDAEGMIEDATEQATAEAIAEATSRAETAATTATSQATASKSYAVGDTGSRSGENTDNSKYYKEQAASSASTATTKASEASASATAAADGEAWAVGKRNGSDVPSTDPTYHNNAKYYAETVSNAVRVNMGTISSLPITKTAIGVNSNMAIAQAVLGTPSAQTGDWTVNTATNSVTVSGTISGSTTLSLLLVPEEEITAS